MNRQMYVAAKLPARRGVALILVLILIVMISLGAYTFTDMMIAEERATTMAGRQQQAQAAVASGVEYLKDYLVLTAEDQAALGGHWDNPTYFKDVAVSPSDPTGVRFAIVSVLQDQMGEPLGWRHGIEDEGSKINLNILATSDLFAPEEEEGATEEGGEESGENPGGEEQAPNQDGPPDAGNQQGSGPQQNAPDAAAGGRGQDELTAEPLYDDPRLNVLMQLPLMTEPIADAILDWIDEDNDPRPSGADGDMYSATLSYSAANGPIGSLDELLLVQGVTPELLYGADRNHNGLIDENEQQFVQAGADGSMARGWSAYLTVNSKDFVPQSEEPAPVDINGDDLEALYDELLAAGIDEDWAAYIIAFRQGGAFEVEMPEDGSEPEIPEPESISGREPTFEGGDNKFGTVLDMIGTMTQGKFQEGEETKDILVESPISADGDLAGVLPTLMSQLSTGNEGGEGRVSLNHCSSSVASGLPGLDYTAAQSILLSADPSGASGDLNYLYPTWPLATGSVTLDQMKALMPYVSGIGTVFRAQIIGYSDVPGVYARAEVVIDASEDIPKVLSWRDLTHLGPGFDRETFLGAGTQ